MNDRDYYTIVAMRKYGGSFVVKLAELAQLGDANNLQKIKETWPEYWIQYEQQGKIIESEAI